MAIRIINAVREDMCDLVNTAANAGSGAGKIKLYTGSVHGTRGTAPSGTLLGTCTCSDPAFTSANGVLTLATVTEDASADDNGTAGCFTLTDSDDNVVLDGSVTATGAGGDLTLNTTTIVAGGPIGITGGTLTLT
jgi:hypothetical protein